MRPERRHNRSVAIVVTLLTVVILLAGCGSTASPAATSSPTAVGLRNRLPVAGGELYANGVNLPWINYGNDIGGNAWGEYGFHDDVPALDADFSAMQEQGVTTARVWLFADARAGIRFDASGEPTSLDPEAYTDLNALTTAASAHGVRLDLVLFDSSFLLAAQNLGGGVVGGGHAGLINAGRGGKALERVVIDPVLRHLAHNPAVFAIETMNEPESCIAQDDDLSSECTAPVSLSNFTAWTRMVASSVHRLDPGVLVTVGSASSRWVGQYRDAGLDFFEVHSYGTSYAPDLGGTPAAQLGLDKPVVIGEYPAAQSTSGFQAQLDAWYGEGYAGAWVWSFRGVDGVGTYDAATMRSWNDAHSRQTTVR